MSTEIAATTQVVNPATGEALTLASPTEDLARCLADIRDFEAQARDVKRALTGELLCPGSTNPRRGRNTFPA